MAFKVEMTRRHVEQRESYRVLAKRVREASGRGISPTSINAMVAEVARRCKGVMEMSLALRPKWEGFLLLDEKMVSVRGNKLWFYVGVDTTGDIVHCRAVNELTSTEAMAFIREIVDTLEYKVQGVTTDLDNSLTNAIRRILPGKPHQICLKHAISSVEKAIGYTYVAQRQGWNRTSVRKQFERLRDRKGIWVAKARREFFDTYRTFKTLSQRHRDLEALRSMLYGIVFARTRAVALEQLREFKRKRPPLSVAPQKRAAVNFLNRYFDEMMTYHSHHGMPRTTNLVENVNKQIERRVKTIEAFQSPSSAEEYMNLLIAYLRQKPYTDCRGPRRHLNGKSRLEAAGVHLASSDWLQNATTE